MEVFYLSGSRFAMEVFYLSGSRFAMEKLNLHSLKTGLVSQFLSKTQNQWETCKHSSTTDLPKNVEKNKLQESFISNAQDVLTHQF